MNLLIRWAKFNLVGVIGMAVQLAALGLFNRCFHGHYLVASAAAVELTLLHNFTWHMLYTWRDRPTAGGTFDRLLRFHLSNGLVSMLGNIALMRLLVSQAHVPLLAANIIAILSCSIINFLLSDAWAFHSSSPSSPSHRRVAHVSLLRRGLHNRSPHSDPDHSRRRAGIQPPRNHEVRAE